VTVRVYTTPSCWQCAMTKKWLNRKGVHYTTVDLTDRANINDYAAVRALGYTSAPVVAIGTDYEIHWSGFRPDLLAEHCLDPED
jgi:glutaredoxin-like protein NrdH